LLAKAGTTTWQTLSIPAQHGHQAFHLTFDGTGRFTYERVLQEGLVERVICDGKTLVHLYPELGLGARRRMSRLHRAELIRLVPWIPPAAEDLAHGADVKCLDARTIAVVPHKKSNSKESEEAATGYTLHLILAVDGKLIERRFIETPSNKTRLR